MALVCYGGISLAVYMHGITKEIWRLARASRAFHAGDSPAVHSHRARLPARCWRRFEQEAGLKLRVLPDIIAGASAGGINGVFLAQAIATGQSLEPLTKLWLETADIEALIDPKQAARHPWTKMWALPIAWMAQKRGAAGINELVEAGARREVQAKLSHFVRSRWFEPPFGGERFSHLILDALGSDGRWRRRRAAAARRPAARPVRHRHRFPRPSRTPGTPFAGRSDGDRTPARSSRSAITARGRSPIMPN